MHPEPVLLALVVIEHFAEVTLRCIDRLGWVVEGHIVGLVEHLEDLGTVLIQGREIEDFEEEGHHVLAHDRGVETELHSGVGDQLGQKVVELRTVVVVMHLDLTILVAFKTAINLKFV